jgi:hypothetical protein
MTTNGCIGDTILDKSSLNPSLTNICTLRVLNKVKRDVIESKILMSQYSLFYRFLAKFIIYVTNNNKTLESEYSLNPTSELNSNYFYTK